MTEELIAKVTANARQRQASIVANINRLCQDTYLLNADIANLINELQMLGNNQPSANRVSDDDAASTKYNYRLSPTMPSGASISQSTSAGYESSMGDSVGPLLSPSMQDASLASILDKAIELLPVEQILREHGNQGSLVVLSGSSDDNFEPDIVNSASVDAGCEAIVALATNTHEPVVNQNERAINDEPCQSQTPDEETQENAMPTTSTPSLDIRAQLEAKFSAMNLNRKPEVPVIATVENNEPKSTPIEPKVLPKAVLPPKPPNLPHPPPTNQMVNNTTPVKQSSILIGNATQKPVTITEDLNKPTQAKVPVDKTRVANILKRYSLYDDDDLDDDDDDNSD